MIFKNWSFLLELSNSWAQRESSDVIMQISHQVWCENFGNTSKNRSRNMFDFGLFFFQFKIHSFDYSPVTRVCDTLGLSLLHVSKGMQGNILLDWKEPCLPAPGPPLWGCAPSQAESIFRRTGRCFPLLANCGLGLWMLKGLCKTDTNSGCIINSYA